MICQYCKNEAELVDSAEIYGRSYGMAYLCRPCNAYVGCHDGTENPKGTLANAELRAARKQAHAAFDPLWKGSKLPKNKARGAGYNFLIEKLDISRDKCHIGMMDIETCQRVIRVCHEKR